MPEESQAGASTANAVVERSVWRMQSTARALISYTDCVHNTTFEPGSTNLAWAVEYSGQVVSKFERRKQKSYRKALIPFGELLMFMPIGKPEDKGEVQNLLGIMLGLVDRSDEVVIGTPVRQLKARTLHRMPAGQRCDARYAKSIKTVP